MDYKKQTRITLKNVKYFAPMSQETHCYTASVYFDGVRVGTTENNGHGGCDSHGPIDKAGWDAMQAYAATLESGSTFHDGSTMDVDLDWVFCELVNQSFLLKDFARAINNRVLYIKDGSLYQTKCVKQKATLGEWVEQVIEWEGVTEVLNMLAPAEAFAIYVEQTNV
jgi:hypothetical protein